MFAAGVKGEQKGYYFIAAQRRASGGNILVLLAIEGDEEGL